MTSDRNTRKVEINRDLSFQTTCSGNQRSFKRYLQHDHLNRVCPQMIKYGISCQWSLVLNSYASCRARCWMRIEWEELVWLRVGTEEIQVEI